MPIIENLIEEVNERATVHVCISILLSWSVEKNGVLHSGRDTEKSTMGIVEYVGTE